MKFAFKPLLALLLVGSAAGAQPEAVPGQITGEWIEPTGSVIRVDHCGPQVCMWVVALSPKAPGGFDIYNPDPAKRTRSLCGLEIGSGFVMRSPEEARGGTLYDPKSGKTYHGLMMLHGNKLELRGYLGFPLFGETQTWTRPAANVKPCTSGQEYK
jgi:uncharacterized protein (DUF2147 family)